MFRILLFETGLCEQNRLCAIPHTCYPLREVVSVTPSLDMPVSVPATLSENRLLAALPIDEYQRLLPQLANVSFALGEVVYEFGGHLDYVYFPTTAIVSLLYTMENGASAEMGLTGNDGVVGIALFMGGGTMPNRAVVQSAGGAIRMKARMLQDEFARGGKFQYLLLRYKKALITRIS